MQAKEQGRTLKRKNKSFICSPMSFDVVNGSNDLGLYHLTKKLSHANKYVRVTATLGLEEHSVSNEMLLIPIF